jgi:hypothetical protein
VLNERHDVGEVVLASVLMVGDCSHSGRSRERRTEREDDLYVAPLLGCRGECLTY